MPTNELWPKLTAFELDAPQCGLTFSERAARENGWKIGFTRRTIYEYKRFLYLAMTCDHVVCPSDAVDQIWHMHLTYTRNYWEELCGGILGRPLHHGPTRGGSKEQEKYFQLYQRTLQSYENAFGASPPADIWPTAEQRFGEDLRFVRVNHQRYWIIPKPRWSRGSVGAASAVLLIPLAQMAANPLDWTGPEFLSLYVVLLGLAIVASWLGVMWLVNSGQNYEFRPGANDALHPIDVGWMHGGNPRAIECALVELVQQDAVSIDGQKIIAGKNIDRYRAKHRVSDLIHQSVASSGAGRDYRVVSRDAIVGIESLRQNLVEKGLLLDWSQRTAAAALPLAFFGSLLGLGAAKAVVGITRGKPIEFLILLLILTVVVLAIFLIKSPRFTLAGKQLLNKLQRQVKQDPRVLSAQSEANAPTTDNESLLWSTAFVGTAALAGTPLFDLSSYFSQRRPPANSSGGCGTSGCGGGGGGSGCGGGGSGCGGGGGCGGCGGS